MTGAASHRLIGLPTTFKTGHVTALGSAHSGGSRAEFTDERLDHPSRFSCDNQAAAFTTAS